MPTTTKQSVNLTEQSPYLSRYGRTSGNSLSRSSLSDATNCVPPLHEALTTSPTMSATSSSTRRSKGSTDRPRSSTSSRHFYASSLGRPPGQQTTTPVATPTPVASSSFPLASSNKTMPVKEIQKLVTDLKKENFDLKLRLYYTEQQLDKGRDKHRLEEDNYRLRMELEEQKKYMDTLEEALAKWEKHSQTQSCDASTQTLKTKSTTQGLRVRTPAQPVSFTSTSSTSSSHTTISANSNSYFPSDPASFGLTSSSSNTRSSTRQKHVTPTLRHDTNKMDMANIVDQFQNVKLHSPRTTRQPPSPDTIQHGRVAGWLDKIIFPPITPDHLPLSPTSVPSTSSFHSPLEYTSPLSCNKHHD